MSKRRCAGVSGGGGSGAPGPGIVRALSSMSRRKLEAVAEAAILASAEGAAAADAVLLASRARLQHSSTAPAVIATSTRSSLTETRAWWTSTVTKNARSSGLAMTRTVLRPTSTPAAVRTLTMLAPAGRARTEPHSETTTWKRIAGKTRRWRSCGAGAARASTSARSALPGCTRARLAGRQLSQRRNHARPWRSPAVRVVAALLLVLQAHNEHTY